jgi:CheY-like chemotaxis protein
MTLTMMLVDDDPDAQRIFKLVIQHHQHQAILAGDAYSAIELLQTEQPEVIVIDLLLPGLDGYQTLDRLRQLAPNAVFVATSAYHAVGTYESVLLRGFKGFLPKPLDASIMVGSLEAMVDER